MRTDTKSLCSSFSSASPEALLTSRAGTEKRFCHLCDYATTFKDVHALQDEQGIPFSSLTLTGQTVYAAETWCRDTNEWHHWSCTSGCCPELGHRWAVAPQSRTEEQSLGPDLPALQVCCPATPSRRKKGDQDPTASALPYTHSQRSSQAEQHGSSEVS